MSSQNKLLPDQRRFGGKKPLFRTQAYLIELKTCVILLREVLEEFKGLLVILLLLAVFILEAIRLIFK